MLKNHEKRCFTFFSFSAPKSVFQALLRIPNGRSRKDLSIGIKDVQFHALGLGIEPF